MDELLIEPEPTERELRTAPIKPPVCWRRW